MNRRRVQGKRRREGKGRGGRYKIYSNSLDSPPQILESHVNPSRWFLDS